jgi:hypothetical protein
MIIRREEVCGFTQKVECVDDFPSNASYLGGEDMRIAQTKLA